LPALIRRIADLGTDLTQRVAEQGLT